MKSEIQKAMVELFNQLDKSQKKIVNAWIVREKKVDNCAIFIGDPKTKDIDGKEVCVMLKKALDADDFSAFTGDTPKPAEPEPEPEKKAPAEKPKPKKKPPAEKKSPAAERVEVREREEGNAIWALEQALAEFIRTHAPAASSSDPVPTAKAEPSVGVAAFTPENEKRIEEIALAAANKVFDERINDAIAEYFKRITG